MKAVWAMLIAGAGLAAGCGKKDFLEAKPSSDLFIPTTLDDFQALMDKDLVINDMPELGELSSDNYYLLYSTWQGLNSTKERNAYTWASDTYQGQGGVDDWNVPYQQVFYANTVLAGIDDAPVTAATQPRLNAIKGAAYFVRAYAFYNLAQLFAPVYDSATAAGDLGIPLRITPGIDAPSVRASVKDTYNQVLTDLAQAYMLLPAAIPFNNRNRPSQPAAMALRARVYLSMRAYAQAGACADSSLRLYNTLINYNTISTSSPTPFNKTNNTETMYQARILVGTQVLKGVTVAGCIIDSTLYRSYDVNDLRQSIFFNAVPNAKGSYTNNIYCFSGIATDEMYLVRAECYARARNTTAAMADLNTLLQNRYKPGFTPLTASGPENALSIILTERRKELFFRGLRWTDLRRLNKEGYNISLTRVLNGQTYQLPPGDLRYTFPIPPDVINLGGIQQNPR